ncbi:MAG TPA: PilZ domain-containing protein [Bdellovibrionales bacterium]|nr:PilZ domain-containing protein [Bdellovibrionales bacterium]
MKVAVIAPDGWGLQGIRENLLQSGVRRYQEFHHLADIASGLKVGAFELLILRIENFSRSSIVQVERLRLIEKEAALISIASHIEPSIRFDARHIAKHILLDERVELRDLSAAIETSLAQSRSRARLHPRVSRADQISVARADGSAKSCGYFVDYAQMGARVVLDGRPQLAVNQSITVEYRSSSDRSRSHRIHSKVAWIRECAEHTLMGVRFIASL